MRRPVLRPGFDVGAYVARWFPRSRGPGDERVVPCLRCGREKCYWNARKGVFYCFRCGDRGTSFAYVKMHRGLDDVATARIIAGDTLSPEQRYDAGRLRH